MAIANLHRMEPEEAKKALDEANGVKEVEEIKPEKKKK